jgi:hypothetical protein
MADATVKIDTAALDPKEIDKIDKSVKGVEQAPTTAQQTPTQDQWTAMRDVLGPPFDSERVTIYQMRQMRKDAMISFGLHYIKVPLVRAEWHIEARDKNGPNAQVAAFVDSALRAIYARYVFQRTLALDFGFQAMSKRFIMKNPGGIFEDPTETNPDNRIKPVWDEGSIDPIIWKTPVTLRPELVTPVFDDKTGEFNGMTYQAPQVGKPKPGQKQKGLMEIDVYHSLWGTNEKDSEMGSIYGFPRTGHARDYWWAYKFLFQLSNRGYERIAIPPVLAFHPEGSTIIDEESGLTQPNWQIALEMADRLRSNAVAAVPSTMADSGLGETSNTQRAWDFKFLETPSEALKIFDERFNYLNVMKLRSVWVPEQAFIEGEGGSSSRNVAAQMAEIFVESQALLMDEIDDEINRFMIPQLLIINFPEFVNNSGVAFKVSHGFRKEDIEFYKQVMQLVGQSQPELIANQIDITELLRRMNTPLRDARELERERQQLAAAQALGKPPLVTPGPRNVGVVANPNVNPGFTNGGSVPQGTAAAVAGFEELSPAHIYIQPNEHIEFLLADAEDFVTGLPSSKHYSDKTLRSLALQMRRLWEAHWRRLYPEFARHVAGVDSLDLADDEKKIRITKKTAEKAAAKVMKSWQVSSDQLLKLAERSREILRKMVTRGAKVDQQKTRIEAELDEDRYDSFLNEQVGRLLKFTDQTFKNDMRDFLVREIQDGNGPKEIGDNIVAHFESVPSTRADRIARSETRDAVNAATLLSGEAAGIRYVRATDGEDFDAECKNRNGRLFTVREAWKELRKEHPNGTLGFDLIPRANFSIEYVEEMPEGTEPGTVAYFDQDSETAFIVFNNDGTDEYLMQLGDWLVNHQNGHAHAGS